MLKYSSLVIRFSGRCDLPSAPWLGVRGAVEGRWTGAWARPRRARGDADPGAARGGLRRRSTRRRGGVPVRSHFGKRRGRPAAREGGYPPKTCSRSASKVESPPRPRWPPDRMKSRCWSPEAGAPSIRSWKGRHDLGHRGGYPSRGGGCGPRGVRSRRVSRQDRLRREPAVGN